MTTTKQPARRAAPKPSEPEHLAHGASWRSRFHKFAKYTAHASGRPGTFIVAVAVVVLWAVTGPMFGFSDTWQLVINTGTTVVTFLMVFLIQNTQNRDADAMQLKLDELIRAVRGAKNALLDLEQLDDEELNRMRESYERMAEHARNELGRRKQPARRRK